MSALIAKVLGAGLLASLLANGLYYAHAKSAATQIEDLGVRLQSQILISQSCQNRLNTLIVEKQNDAKVDDLGSFSVPAHWLYQAD